MSLGNELELCGVALTTPILSHESHANKFYAFILAVKRLSDAEDHINVLAGEQVLEDAPVAPGAEIRVIGEIRSFNNKRAEYNRLKISAWAKTIEDWAGEARNRIRLSGQIWKPPTFRLTPYGREITDIMLCVERRATPADRPRRDFIPCIAWGATARACAAMREREKLTFDGRLQSRKYIKLIDDESFERTAYEVSITSVL